MASSRIHVLMLIGSPLTMIRSVELMSSFNKIGSTDVFVSSNSSFAASVKLKLAVMTNGVCPLTSRVFLSTYFSFSILIAV